MSIAETAAEGEFPFEDTRESLADRLLEIDFTRPLAFAALAFAFVLSRVPLVNMGYGTDPDAWRVALSAHHLLNTHEYLPSRLPGYPMHEFVTAALIRFGWIATNLSTVAISLVAVYLFARLLNELGLRARGVLVLGFAFAPLVWINSAATMDYMWALAFILAAYLVLMHGYPGWGGIMLGLAIAFRPASIIMALPFILLLLRTGRRSEAGGFLGATFMTAAVPFVPLIATYGLAALNFYDAKVPLDAVLRLLGKEALGVIGALAVLIGLIVSLPRLVRLPRDVIRDPHVLVWVSAILVYLYSFSRLPHEIAYLIPLFPFGYFIMSRYMKRGVIAGVVAVVIVAGFVDFTSPGDAISLSALREVSVGRGIVLSNQQTQSYQHAFADELAAQDLPNNSVVITGFIFPQLAMRHIDEWKFGILDRNYDAISMISDWGKIEDTERGIVYVWLLSREQFDGFRDRNYNFYFVHDAAKSTAKVFEYRPGYYGATALKLSRESPSEGSGSADTDR